MSNTSRSESSSPDILGPPGDADYLISSPAKPFSGRQSWMSPAIAKRQQTPAKRPRVSLSPAKSAHSIRFDDVLLPGSPTMKLDGRQRSFSPDKVQQDGNLSPWRIRVTLEATQDEENQVQNSPSRKRGRPTTVTTKIPLKDERSPLTDKTPGRKRGRPRKSDTRPPNGSPWPGSPGHTPGPNDGSAQKRKPGRPRKSTPNPKRQEIILAEDVPIAEPEPLMDMSPMDMTADNAAGPVQQWSPINMAIGDNSDSDSLGADDLPVANLKMPTPAHADTWTQSNGHEYGRANYDTPVIGDTERHFQDDDENIHSTPSKMPSPTRERSSSVRSSRLAGNAPSPRPYSIPTPSSSLVEAENRARENNEQPQIEHDTHHQPTSAPLADPTDDHEEFDSIMESEGFTMVSLDTLPSAKQFGLGSGTRNAPDNAAKILRDREDGRIGEKLKRKLPGISDLRSDSHSSARPSPVALGPSPGDRIQKHQDSFAPVSREPVSYPEIPEALSPQKSAEFQDEQFVPNGVDEYEDEAEDYVQDYDEQGQELEEEEMEMEDEEELEELEEDDEGEDEPVMLEPPHLSDSPQRYNPQRYSPDLRRANEAHWQEEREFVSRQAADPTNAERLVYISSDENVPHSDHFEEDFGNSPAINVQAQNEEQMFDNHYDDDDVSEEDIHEQPRPPTPPRRRESSVRYEQAELNQENSDRDDESVDIWQQGDDDDHDAEPQPDPEPEPEQYQPSPNQGHGDDGNMVDNEGDADGGFDDIWQMEARDHSQLSQHSDEHPPPSIQKSVTPWKSISRFSSQQNSLSSSPAYVAMEHDDAQHFDQTYIRKLQDQEVDLSAIMGEEDTPNRARYYNGTSTPRSILSRHSSAKNPSINDSALQSNSSRKSEKRVRLQPISQSPEPKSHSPVDSPAPHPRPQLEPLSEEIHEDEEEYDAGFDARDPESSHDESAVTPEQQRQTGEIGEPSSWFRRITSLTPRWLKAPAQSRYDSSSEPSEDEQDDNQSEPEEPLNTGSAYHIHADIEHEPLPNPRDELSPEPIDESASNPSVIGERHMSSIEEEDQFVEQEEPNETIEQDEVEIVQQPSDKLNRPRPLAVFGYFSNAHYNLLRRIYRMTKRHPDRFPYFDAPGRADIIGDWMWTSDGHHGVPITEVQFAIIDRFVHELSHADIEYGGSGQVDWTEAELHRRLISVIIGEQIREERKAKTARSTSVDTWR